MQSERFLEAEFDKALMRELHNRIKLTAPPSQHIQAWWDYDYQKFEVLGRHPPAHIRAYNLYTDASGLMHWAYKVLTDVDYRRGTGRTTKTISRHALAALAKAFGYRYMRGLGAIDCKLKGEELEQFRQSRLVFRNLFEQKADAAHLANDKGQNPGMVIEVIRLFERELLELFPYLGRAGAAFDGHLLRKNATLPKHPANTDSR